VQALAVLLRLWSISIPTALAGPPPLFPSPGIYLPQFFPYLLFLLLSSLLLPLFSYDLTATSVGTKVIFAGGRTAATVYVNRVDILETTSGNKLDCYFCLPLSGLKLFLTFFSFFGFAGVWTIATLSLGRSHLVRLVLFCLLLLFLSSFCSFFFSPWQSAASIGSTSFFFGGEYTAGPVTTAYVDAFDFACVPYANEWYVSRSFLCIAVLYLLLVQFIRPLSKWCRLR
jgi:hypothetical protein